MKNRLINYFAFAVLALLWLAFLFALVFNREMLATAWQAFRAWPLVVQGVVGLLTLPVVLGLWIWQASWVIWVRILLVLGLAWVTLYTFFPRRTSVKAAASPERS